MRGLPIYLAVLLSLVGLAPVRADTATPSPPSNTSQPPKTDAGAQTARGCSIDDMQPKPVENAKVSIDLDPKTAWQPSGGTVGFTISSVEPLDGVKVIVCFGWPKHWKATVVQGLVSVAKADVNSTSYRVVVPDLKPVKWIIWRHRTALWMVPLATMRILAYGGAMPEVDVQSYVGITSPFLALLQAVLAVAIAMRIFYAFAKSRGVPGKGVLLWMVSTPDGVASLSQTQIVLWTFLIGASAIYVMALSGVLINLSTGTLVLLGITGIATLGAKLQDSQQGTKDTTRPDGRTAVPGQVVVLAPQGPASDTEVRLAWMPPTSGGPVMRYIVEYQLRATPDAPEGPVWISVGETIVLPHHTVLGLAPKTNYKFRVRAANAGGAGAPAECGPLETQDSARIPQDAPGQIRGLYVDGATTLTEVNLAWSPAEKAPTSYSVQYRRHDSLDAWNPVSQAPTQANCTVDDLVSGVEYDFRVAALNASGQGAWSAVVTARTIRNPLWADLVVTGDGRGEIDVTRAQMLFFTLVAALFVGMKVITSYVIPEIPDGILLLMGISNGVYITAKFIPT